MKPDKIYYEPTALTYELGHTLHERYSDIP